MPPLPIVEDLYVFEYILLGFLSGAISLMVRQLSFQRVEKAFRRCIIPAVPTPAHTADEPIALYRALVKIGCILTTPVAVYHQTCCGLALPHSHHQGIVNQGRRHSL